MCALYRNVAYADVHQSNKWKIKVVVLLVLCDKVLSSVKNWHCEQDIGVKRMSGPIRRLIGPAKSRLLKYIETANGLMERKLVETKMQTSQLTRFDR